MSGRIYIRDARTGEELKSHSMHGRRLEGCSSAPIIEGRRVMNARTAVHTFRTSRQRAENWIVGLKALPDPRQPLQVKMWWGPEHAETVWLLDHDGSELVDEHPRYITREEFLALSAAQAAGTHPRDPEPQSAARTEEQVQADIDRWEQWEKENGYYD